jgi:hypothetical protein
MTDSAITSDSDVDLSGFGPSTRYEFDNGSATVRALDSSDGRMVSVLTHDRPIPASGRTKVAATANLFVSGRTVSVAVGRGLDVRYYELAFPNIVLDATDLSIDSLGRIWMLVGSAVGAGVQRELVRLDPMSGTAVAALVDTHVSHDVTRQLVPDGDAVCLATSDESGFTLTRYVFGGR